MAKNSTQVLVSSKWKVIILAVPQVSVLGPPKFDIYIYIYIYIYIHISKYMYVYTYIYIYIR